MFERYSFVAMTTADLAAARAFWVEKVGFAVTEDRAGHHFIIDAGGLRLCVDAADGEVRVAGGSDPVIGLKVASLTVALDALAARGLRPAEGSSAGERGAYAVFRDPDGRAVIITEGD